MNLSEERLHQVIDHFIDDFNQMCKSKRKDLLLRERMVNYESGSRLVSYRISYKVKATKKDWQIYGATSGFWIFKKKFPLFRIVDLGDKLSFAGLYTDTLSTVPRSSSLLKEQLTQYLNICAKLPQNAFVRS